MENKVSPGQQYHHMGCRSCSPSACVQVDEVKGELMERYKVLPALSSRLAEVESQNKELREKNKQLEMKLGTMQVSGCCCSVSSQEPSGLTDSACVCGCVCV